MSDVRKARDESSIREACGRGDFGAATELALEMYGAEILGFLVGVHRDYDDADDAFSKFCERLWLQMPRFGWNCSMRTWAYLLARTASADARRGLRQRRRGVDGSGNARLSQIEQQVRTATLSMLRSERRTSLEELCQSLNEDDRELLILRVSRELSWRDVALILGHSTHGEGTLEKEVARIRKRYQILRERLQQLGRSHGLL